VPGCLSDRHCVYADSTAGRNIDKVREGLKELAGRLAAALL